MMDSELLGPDQGYSDPQEPDQGNTEPWEADQGDSEPWEPDKGNRKPWERDQEDSKPHEPDQGNTEPWEPDKGNRKPWERDQEDSKPQEPDQGTPMPLIPERGDVDPQEPNQGDTEPHKLDQCADNQQSFEPSSEGNSPQTPWTLIFFLRLIRIWPDMNVKVVPHFVKALVGLLASNYALNLMIKLLSLNPSLLWCALIILVSNVTWGNPNLHWSLLRDGVYLRNESSPYTSYIWCLVPVLCVTFLLKDVQYSSVWCSKAQHQLRTCHFTNLYYKAHQGFFFVLDDSSVISGIQHLEEFKNLKMSPIADHKGVNMDITMVRSSDVSPVWKFPSFGFVFTNLIETPHFAVHRFKPDNLMHVVHDDLIPLFIKFRQISMGNVRQMASTTSLFFADMNDLGPFGEWYQALSTSPPLLAKELSYDKLYCFSSLYVGPSNTSFFQYGFDKPQGPIGPNLIGRDITEFKQYYLNYFGVKPQLDERKVKITLISRKFNRKILNEDTILDMFTTPVNGDGFFSGKTLVFAKGDMMANLKEMVSLVASSDVVVAMHGAETALCLFLPESSVLIEMFPFGICRENVSPVYSLSKAEGVHFKYLSWSNLNENNSVVHPEYLKEFGGVEELPDELKRKIYSTKKVPAVQCCHNPFYLFRMYQDTIIDESFSKVAFAAVEWLKSKTPIVSAESQWYFPGRVLDLNCHRHPNHIYVTWTAPRNVANVPTKYDVTVLADSVHRNTITDKSTLRFDFGEHFRVIQVWVLSEVNGKKSIDSYTKCIHTSPNSILKT